MAHELSYRAEAAAEYDRAFSHVSTYFLPFLLRAAQLGPGQRVLDVATGTGVAAEAALTIIGAEGSIIAADLSPEMVEKARQRLGKASNAVGAVEDGQALSFPDQSFDVVLCSLGLMFFPDPLRGLREFGRVLRPGGRAAVSVTTTPDHSYNGRINIVVARYVPSLAEATARTFALGEATSLQPLFLEAGFANVETHTEKHNFTLPSFDAYYGPFERGGRLAQRCGFSTSRDRNPRDQLDARGRAGVGYDAMTTDHRTVADIIAGRMSGVFGTVVRVSELGATHPGKYPLVAMTLHNSIGLPLCDCGVTPPHADVLFAGLNCEPGEAERTYALMRNYVATGRNVELVGDVVQMLRGFPLVSGFPYYGGAPLDMTVPDRASLGVNEHCRTCPLPSELVSAMERRARRSAKRAEVAERQARKRKP